MTTRSWRLLDILAETSRYFARRNLENPRLQAELLLADVLQVRRVDLYLQFERLLTPAEVDAYREHVRQRGRRRPLQYITGTVGFRELVLQVHDGVLIPRPETEEVTGVVLECLAGLAAPRVLDLGCGTGAIGIAVAHEHPGARVVVVDVSAAALANARANAAGAGVAERVEVVAGDMRQDLAAAGISGAFDVVVSNPPYVKRADIAALAPEVRDHEPHAALDGGEDGLAFYRSLAVTVVPCLAPAGCLVLELGYGQAAAVGEILAAAGGWEVDPVRADLSGVPRILTARRGA